MRSFTNLDGVQIIFDMIKNIRDNKQYLSDIDGAAGDGDHGINMSKGFDICGNELEKTPGDLTHGLKVLSKVLMADIGGAMGPLYGTFFKSMAKVSGDNETIDAQLFGEMLSAAERGVRNIGGAEAGDKTILDTLVPAVSAYHRAAGDDRRFAECAADMKAAAIAGRDSTKDMTAKTGRAARLGERSRGTVDAGAASCCIILSAFADFIIGCD